MHGLTVGCEDVLVTTVVRDCSTVPPYRPEDTPRLAYAGPPPCLLITSYYCLTYAVPPYLFTCLLTPFHKSTPPPS